MPDKKQYNRLWERQPERRYTEAMARLFRSGTPEAQDSSLALKRFLVDRNYPPPRVGDTGDDQGITVLSEDSTRAPAWKVGGYEYVPHDTEDPYWAQMAEGSHTVPHELSHIQDAAEIEPKVMSSQWEKEAVDAFNKQGDVRYVYTTPGTQEYNATFGRGLAIQDTLSQMIRAEMEKRLRAAQNERMAELQRLRTR